MNAKTLNPRGIPGAYRIGDDVSFLTTTFKTILACLGALRGALDESAASEWVGTRSACSPVRRRSSGTSCSSKCGRGSGQGLSLVRRTVIEMHGGTVSFETTEGAGTTFIVRVPIEPPADAREHPS